MENVNIKSGDYQQNINRKEKPKTVKISRFANLKNRIQRYWLNKKKDKIEKEEANIESDINYYSRSLTESKESKKTLSDEKQKINDKIAILDEYFNNKVEKKASKPIRIAATALYNITNFLQSKATSLYSKKVIDDQDIEPVIAKSGREPVEVAPTRTNSDGFKKIEGLVDTKGTELKGKKDENKQTEPDLSSSKPVDITDDSKKNDPISFGQASLAKEARKWNDLINQTIDIDIPESDITRQKPMPTQKPIQKPIKNSTTDDKKTTKSTADAFHDKHGFYQNSGSYFASDFDHKVEKPMKIDKATIDKQKQMNNETENAIKKQQQRIEDQKAKYEEKMAAILKAAQAKEEARKASLMQQQQDLMKQAENEKQQQNQALADMMAEYGIKPEDLEKSQEKTR